jgi:hypothetical protein
MNPLDPTIRSPFWIPDSVAKLLGPHLESDGIDGAANPATTKLGVSLVVGLLVALLAVGCGGPPPRVAPPAPTPDSRLMLGSPVAKPRAGAPGGPVDCAIDVANQAGQTLSRLIVTCELLDSDGVPIGAGLGTAQNLANGDRQTVRTVVYGVRVFSSARAVVTQAIFQ